MTVLLTTISAVVTVAAFPDSGDDGPTSDYTIALILQIVAFLLQIGLYASIQDAGPLAGKIAGKIGMILGILGLLLALVANALSWYHISDIAGAQIMMSAMAEMAAALGGAAADAVPDFTVSLYFSCESKPARESASASRPDRSPCPQTSGWFSGSSTSSPASCAS